MNFSPYEDKKYLQEQQYKDSRNLSARAALHELYSQAEQPWHAWVCDQLELQPDMRVLECGGGPGWLWRHNLQRIPTGCRITFTDFSPGMLAEAQAAIADQNERFIFQAVNIEELPFPDDAFDIVIANHMLYHVSNLPQALSGVRQVLRADGRFFAATNGNNHMAELQELAEQLFPELSPGLQLVRNQRQLRHQLSFRLENGREQLSPFFSEIECPLYADFLKVTDANHLLNYMFSMIDTGAALPAELRARAAAALTEKIERDGAIHISKETGLFIARGHAA